MPYYEYHCDANGRTIEVRHGMDERLSTWGDLARASGIEPEGTPEDAPVERLMSAPVPITGEASDFPGCGSGCACAPGH